MNSRGPPSPSAEDRVCCCADKGVAEFGLQSVNQKPFMHTHTGAPLPVRRADLSLPVLAWIRVRDPPQFQTIGRPFLRVNARVLAVALAPCRSHTTIGLDIMMMNSRSIGLKSPRFGQDRKRTCGL